MTNQEIYGEVSHSFLEKVRKKQSKIYVMGYITCRAMEGIRNTQTKSKHATKTAKDNVFPEPAALHREGILSLLHRVQTGSGDYRWESGVDLPGRAADHSSPHLVSRLRMRGAIQTLPHMS
jgi:hypothetical protein